MLLDERKRAVCFLAIEVTSLCCDNSLSDVENYLKDKLSEEVTFSYFNVGLKLICNGATPELLSLTLDCEKMKWIKDPLVTHDDLQLIVLINKLILCVHSCNLDLLQEYCEFMLPSSKNEISEKLDQIRQKLK